MMKQTIPLVACLLLVPSSTIAAEAISPTRIHAPSTTPPINTAAKILSDFLRSKGVELPILTEVAENDPPVAGTILLGTTADSPVLARWAREGRLQVSASESAGDWHHLRPAWSGPVLRSPLTIEALQTVTLSGAEPPKPHGERDYAPYRDDIARSNALAPALRIAADHFGKALAHLRTASALVRDDARSTLDHWCQPELGGPARFTPRQVLDEQIIAVRLQEQCQLRMSRFFEAWALVKTLPPAGTPEHQAALKTLEQLRAEDEAFRQP